MCLFVIYKVSFSIYGNVYGIGCNLNIFLPALKEFRLCICRGYILRKIFFREILSMGWRWRKVWKKCMIYYYYNYACSWELNAFHGDWHAEVHAVVSADVYRMRYNIINKMKEWRSSGRRGKKKGFSYTVARWLFDGSVRGGAGGLAVRRMARGRLDRCPPSSACERVVMYRVST